MKKMPLSMAITIEIFLILAYAEGMLKSEAWVIILINGVLIAWSFLKPFVEVIKEDMGIEGDIPLHGHLNSPSNEEIKQYSDMYRSAIGILEVSDNPDSILSACSVIYKICIKDTNFVYLDKVKYRGQILTYDGLCNLVMSKLKAIIFQVSTREKFDSAKQILTAFGVDIADNYINNNP